MRRSDRRSGRPARLASLAPVLLSLLAGCEDEKVRTWRPEDHGHNQRGGQVDGTAAPGAENAARIAVAWERHCATCHGPKGRGNGPQARMMKVPDLTRASFQKGYEDAQIASVIREGRNQMPAFGSKLDEEVVEGLVDRIRAFGGRN